jgi:hypothetical protein
MLRPRGRKFLEGVYGRAKGESLATSDDEIDRVTEGGPRAGGRAGI